MKRVLSVICFVLFVCLSAMAQEYPKAEVFGGYSYFRADGGGNLHGWNASVGGNLNSWFGLVADFSGHYDSRSSRSELRFPPFPGSPRFQASPSFNLSQLRIRAFTRSWRARGFLSQERENNSFRPCLFGASPVTLKQK